VVALREGIVRLRIGELADGWEFGRAQRAFDRARGMQDWPFPWYGHGLASAGKAAWQAATPLNIGLRVGDGARRDAVLAFGHALDRDSHFVPALLGLSRVRAAIADTAVERATLARLRDAGPDVPVSVLAERARLERLVGDADSAVVIAERRMALVDSERALAELDLARSLFVRGDLSGVAHYYAGASSDDSAVVAAYREDLAPIADSLELAAFDEAGGMGRVSYLRRFWQRRDRLDLRADGERLREHYARLAYARSHYPLLTNRRRYAWVDPYHSGSEVLDDRGIMYVRHGAPDEKVTVPLIGMMPNESWVYHRPDGDFLLHFSAGGRGTEGGDIADYRLVPSVYDLRGDERFTPVDMLLQSREPLSDLYTKLMAWGPMAAARVRRQEREIGMASIVLGTTSDDHLRRYARPLDVIATTLNVGQAPDGSLVHLVLAIPVTAADAAAAPFTLVLRLRVAFFDTTGSVTHPVEQPLVLDVPPQAREGGFLLAHAAVALPPGTWWYHAALERDDSTGTLLPTGVVAVAPFDGGRLELSDIVLGRSDAGPAWLAGPMDTVVFDPLRTYRPGETTRLYYEVYGVPEGATWQTRIMVVRRKAGRPFDPGRPGRAAMRLNFSEPPPRGPVRVSRSLKLEGADTGDWWLVVTVRSRGREATRAIPFIVAD
jgi:GWxTD domain-containing protein